MQLMILFLAQGLSHVSSLLPAHKTSWIWILGVGWLAEDSAGRFAKKADIGKDLFISLV